MKKTTHDLKRQLKLINPFAGTQPVVIGLSILAAIIIWFAIVLTVYPSTPKRFYNIPVKVDLTGTNAEANGLSAVGCDVESVSVELTGDRSQIGLLTADDLTAYAEVGALSSTGSYTVNIDVRTDTGISFSVDKVVPNTATIKLDKIETRTFNVEASFPNIVVTSGLVN